MKKFYSPFCHRTVFVLLFMLTFVKGWGQKNYSLVTSTGDLTAGSKYIIANGSSGSVNLLGPQTTNNRTQTTTTPVTGGNITITPSTTTAGSGAFEITLNGSSGAWVLYDAVNNINLGPDIGNTTGNHLKLNASATYSISFNTNAAIITAVTSINTNGRNIIRYNSASSIFSSYASGQAAVYLYKEVPSTSPNLTISGTPTNHGAVCLGTPATSVQYTITNAGTAASGVTVVSNNPEFVVSGLSSTTIAANGGTATYTVTFTPTAAGARSATVTVTSTTSGSNAPSSSLTGTGTAIALGTVTTNAVGTITARSAVLNGTVNTIGSCPSISERGFVYSQTSTNGDPANGGSGVTTVPVTGITATSFTNTPNTLLPSTQYTYKAYVLNGSTYTYGTPVTFTTSPALEVTGTYTHDSSCPSVSAAPLTYRITNNSVATVTGINVSSNNTEFVVGGATATSLAPGAFTTYTVTFTPASSGIMSSTISIASSQPTITNTVTGTGLTPVSQSVGTAAATVITGTAANLNASNATIGICPATITKGFVISKTTDNAMPTIGGAGVTNEIVTPVGGNGSFSKAVANLTIDTGYSYRAYVYDGTTYIYGAVVTFATPLVSSASDYFRSRQTGTIGSWNAVGSWDSSSDGVTWISSTLVPNNNAKKITIRNGHTINVTSAITADEVLVENSGVLAITGSNIFTILDGIGDDLIVNGILRQSGSTSILQRGTGATFVFNDGSSYESSRANVFIPTATWHANSNCVIKGNVSGATYAQFNQTFGNITWDAVQSANITLSNTVTTFKVVGTFELLNTNGWTFCFNSSTTEKNYEVGNLILRNDAMVELSNKDGGADANNRHTYLKILGDLSLFDTSEIDFGYGTSDGPSYYDYPVRSVINLAGNLYASANSKLYIGGSNVSYGVINFENISEKTVSILNPNTDSILFDVLPNSKVKVTSDIPLNNYVELYVEGALDIGTYVISSESINSNYFYTYPNSILKIAHPEGISNFTTFPTTGAIRVVDGDYDINGNYIYYGTSNQNTGNGLPAIVKNISIENTGASGSNEVTLTNTELGVTEDLNVNNGIFNINDKEVFGGGVTTSDLRVSAGSELKIGGNRTFPVDFGTITFAPLSTIHYAGQDQTIAHVNTTTYANLPSYENLKISGTGIKSPVTDLTVNNIATITAGTLQITETADNVQPHVFKANKGLQITGGNVILANNANLLQDVGAVNLGSVQAERKTSMKKMDYTYWSSPVQGDATTGQRLLNTTNANLETSSGGFSPTTPNNRIYRYNEPNDYFIGTTDSYFIPGRGYAIRGKNGYGTTKTADTFSFTGTPNNGDAITVSVQRSPNNTFNHGFNLIGNPYPSGLSFEEFAEDNIASIKGTAWFWSNLEDNLTQTGSTNTKHNNYAVYTLAGGSPPTTGAGGLADYKPTGNIKVGQGFIVQVRDELASTSLVTRTLSFKNEMRTTGSGVFFNNPAKQSQVKDRYWLRFVSPDNVVNTILLAHLEKATDGYDQDYDANLFTVGDDSFYSFLGTRKLQIQAKGAFVQESKIDLGTKQNKNGNYTIKLEQPEGVFANGQAVYLHDKLSGTYTNLLEQSFTFAATLGATENRFEIVYKNNQVLGTDVVKESDFRVYRDGTNFVIRSSSALGKIELYDLGGKLISAMSSTQKEFRLDASALPSGVYIIRAENSGNTRTKKIIK